VVAVSRPAIAGAVVALLVIVAIIAGSVALWTAPPAGAPSLPPSVTRGPNVQTQLPAQCLAGAPGVYCP
jgi:hypothetical protein